MQTCLWLSVGAPDQAPMHLRASCPSRIGSACRLEASQSAA